MAGAWALGWVQGGGVQVAMGVAREAAKGAAQRAGHTSEEMCHYTGSAPGSVPDVRLRLNKGLCWKLRNGGFRSCQRCVLVDCVAACDWHCGNLHTLYL
jgi:hypothetical protein